MTSLSTFALLLISAALSGCAARVTTHPGQSEVVPAGWRSEYRRGELEVNWWRAFGDPVLTALVEQALRRNGDLDVAKARVREFTAGVALARSSRDLHVGAGIDAGRGRTQATSGYQVGNALSAEMFASYEVDLWGRAALAQDAAEALLAAERSDNQALALSISASVASAYLGLRGMDAQLELASDTVAVRERSRDLARRQFEAGYSSRLELLQAQSELEAASQQLPILRDAILRQENRLAILCGDTLGPVSRGGTIQAMSAPEIPLMLPSVLLERRPDIARDGHAMVASGVVLEATRLQSLPALRLSASGGLQAATLGSLLNAHTALWQLGTVLGATVLDGGRRQAQTDAAAAQRDQAVAAYQNTVRTAFVEVDDALSALRRLREQETLNDSRRSTADRVLALARQRYRAGYSSYLEELDAQRTLYVVEQAQIQLRTRSLIAAVDLYRALGGGWNSTDTYPERGRPKAHFLPP